MDEISGTDEQARALISSASTAGSLSLACIHTHSKEPGFLPWQLSFENTGERLEWLLRCFLQNWSQWLVPSKRQSGHLLRGTKESLVSTLVRGTVDVQHQEPTQVYS